MLSVIVPAYNEAQTIHHTVVHLRAFLDSLDTDYELLVIDDGSTDGTGEEADRHSNERVRIYRYTPNLGKGHALRYGFGKSRGDVIAFYDAGLNFPVENVTTLLHRLELGDSDLVIGSKYLPESKVTYPFHRKLVSAGGQLLVKLLFNLDTTDTQVGLKVFRRAVLDKIMPLIIVKRYAFDIELLALAKRYGYRIAEEPVELNLHISTAVNFESLWVTLVDALAIFYRARILKFYDRPAEERERLLAKYPAVFWDKVIFWLAQMFRR